MADKEKSRREVADIIQQGSPIFMQLDSDSTTIILSAENLQDFHDLIGMVLPFENVKKVFGEYKQKEKK